MLQGMVTGAILLSIAVLDAPDLARRIVTWRLNRTDRGVYPPQQ